MIIIAPTNNKGGVGKTKVSILLAEYISVYLKKRVLAIDFDPQCNFSHRFLEMEVDPAASDGLMPPVHPDYNPADPEDANWDGRSSIGDIFFGNGVLPYPTYIENLDIAPGHAHKLLLAEAVRRTEVAEKVYKQLSLFLSMPDVNSTYDVAIIDTAPSKGPLTISAIKAATHIIIPCIMEEQPIQGIYGMLQLWMQETHQRSDSNPIKLVGILPNMFRPINLHNDLLESLKQKEGVSKYIMPVRLGQRAAFAETDVDGAVPQSVFNLSDSNPSKQEALKVCEYITKEVFPHG